MKKFFVLLCLFICLFALSGCKKTTTDQYEVEREIRYGLLEIEKFSDDGVMTICCDPSTNICYLFMKAHYNTGISPYYVMGKDGKPEIAIYGVNYKPKGVKNGN